MRSGFEREIRPVPPADWRSGMAPCFGMDFEVLPSSMVVILCLEMRSKLVKSNQTKSNLLRGKLNSRKKAQNAQKLLCLCGLGVFSRRCPSRTRSSRIKVNQTKSNQIKPEDMMPKADVAGSLNMDRFVE